MKEALEMLSIPTDRLNKFLAVGGFVVSLLTLYASFYSYNNLRHHQIQAQRKNDVFTYAHERQKNFWIEAASHYKALSNQFGDDRVQKRLEMEKYEPIFQANRLRVHQELEQALLQSQEAIRLAVHYEKIFNWVLFGGLPIGSIAIVLSTIGFVGWRKESVRVSVSSIRRLKKRS